MSANRSQRVTSQFLRSPSNSKMNSSTSPRWSRYLSRRCCLQMSAVCFCRFLVSNPICAPNFCTGYPVARYVRDFLLLNLAIISSAVSSPFLIFSTTVRNAKPSLGSESTKRLRSAIGPRVSYCLSSSGDTSRASAIKRANQRQPRICWLVRIERSRPVRVGIPLPRTTIMRSNVRQLRG